MLELAAIGCIFCALGDTSAGTIVSTFGPGDTFQSSGRLIEGSAGIFSHYIAQAAGFTPTVTAAVGKIEVALSYGTGANPTVMAELFADSGNRPGTLIETYSLGAIPNDGIASIFVAISPNQPTLFANTPYWLAVLPADPNSDTTIAWRDQPAAFPSGLEFTSSDPTLATGFTSTTFGGFAYRIDDNSAAAVPEPSAIVIWSVVAILLSIGRIRKASGGRPFRHDGSTLHLSRTTATPALAEPQAKAPIQTGNPAMASANSTASMTKILIRAMLLVAMFSGSAAPKCRARRLGSRRRFTARTVFHFWGLFS
jgi:hypothetical protein